jgi:peptide-methionine (S)-S-oxide reductase
MKTIASALLIVLMIGQLSPAEETPMPTPPKELATLAGGCFWCIEAVFQRVPGVLSVRSGYIGGDVDQPTYYQVCQGNTGHAEAVEITFDPARVSYAKLLDIFWQAHNPTHLNRQGHDVGTQYRSAIFYHSDAQKDAAEKSIQQLEDSGQFQDPIVTQVSAATTFFPAEVSHQDYFNRNKNMPYCRAVIQPKLDKLGFEK